MKPFKTSVLVIVVVISTFVIFINFKIDDSIHKLTTVESVLNKIGQGPALHVSFVSTPELIASGKEIVENGVTTINGKKTSKQSKHFSCRSCHNSEREDLDIGNPNPTDRLKYAIDHKLPFLQATTFWGIVNRESWYNGDYVKKYGDKVVLRTLLNQFEPIAS